jgi:glutamate N-acetyltransferase/amino-acid N-acetyltransferase
MSGAVSPLAPAELARPPEISGVRLTTSHTGLRYKNRDDLLVAVLPEGSAVAGVLTKSAAASAPVFHCRRSLETGRARGLVVNAGNANAFTGAAGPAFAKATAEAMAARLGCPPGEILLASTGVIGQPLPEDALARRLPAHESAPAANWETAARAIMTTDTFPKLAGGRARGVSLSGIAKGSGMIAPDMATMLGFLFTDAAISPGLLQELVRDAADRSFNSITVDGDTSTSDTLLVFATNAGPKITEAEADGFVELLRQVTGDLARQIVRDGEGARKFVSIRVEGAASDASARAIGKTIANSPLVKTAIAGEDANWGRIVAAAGRAGEPIDMERLKVSIGGVSVAAGGGPVEGYDETPVAAHMKGMEIDIRLELGLGAGRAEVWTCDLTERYIAINADYRS